MGADKLKKAVSTLKPTSQPTVLAIIDKIEKAGPPPASAPTASASASSATTSGEGDGEKTGAAKGAVKSRTGSSSSVASKDGAAAPGGKGNKSEEVLDMSLASDGKKAQREKDEKALKVLKWNFTAPRPEYITQLQEQCKGSFGKHLFSLVFGDDFRGHIKALDALSEMAKQDNMGIIANMDLILKWITLRFFDTNTAVLLRTLQFLQVNRKK